MNFMQRGTERDQPVGRDKAVVLGFYRAPGGLGKPSPGYPGGARFGQSRIEVDPGRVLSIRARRVVKPQWRLLSGGMQRDLTEWHQNVGPPLWRGIDFMRANDRPGGHVI
jgi:hypothetical protein